MNTKNVNKLVVIPLVFILVLTLSITYALFTKSVNTNGRNITISSTNKYIGIYGTNKDNIELNKDYTFTIENRGSSNAGYEVYIESETNIDLSTITYTVGGDFSKTGTLSDTSIIYSALASEDTKTITLRLTSASTENYVGKLKIRYKEYVVNYNYNGTDGTNGSVQTFTTPTSGNYKLEVWGAQGAVGKGQSEYTSIGGYGGYSVGVTTQNKNTTLNIYVGGQGGVATTDNTINVGGYNGGASSGGYLWGRAGSGGATHIALESGLLSALESYKGTLDSTNSYYVSEKILIVAGGGGVFCPYIQRESSIDCTTASGGSNGGGFRGMSGNLGGSQTSGGISTTNDGTTLDPDGNGRFGTGTGQHSQGHSSSSGGGGFFGGAGINNQADACGGGGSGYIASSNLISYGNVTKHMACYNCTTSSVPAIKTETKTCHNVEAREDCAKEKNGYARITYIGN